MAALQAVNQQMDTLRIAGTLTEATAMDYLKSRPEFVAVGSVKPGGVWARFADNVPLIVSFNFPPEVGRAAALPPSRAANSEVPTPDQVRVLNALGTAFLPPHDEIRSWLVKHGYLPANTDATIEGLKSVQGDGVFYINTHGDYCTLPDGTDTWAMWTLDEVTAAKTATYANLLASGALVMFSAVHDKAFFSGSDPENLRGVTATHYAITRRFAEQFNWHFGQDSFVFFNCCWSADPDFVQMCFDRGVSVYAGWNNAAVPSGAWRAARFVFDHMLGQLSDGNQAYPEPGGLQRAFDAAAIKQELNARGWNVTDSPTYGQAALLFVTNSKNNDFGLLAPSIRNMEVDEGSGRLILHGQFGSEKSNMARFVTINGTRELTILSWQTDRIECDLPLDASGDVQVRVGVRKSNVRQLTEWKLTVQYQWNSLAPTGLTVSGPVNLRFRGDIGDVRDKPGDTPTKPVRTMAPTRDSGTTQKATGSAPTGGCTTSWSGQETFDIPESHPSATRLLLARLKVDTTTKKGALGLAYGHPGDWKLIQTTVCPSGSSSNLLPIAFGIMDGAINFQDPLGQPNIPDLPLPGRNLSFDSNFGILADSFDQMAGVIHMQWATTPALHPPDVNAARSAPQK